MDINGVYELLLNLSNLQVNGVDIHDRKINIYCEVKSREQACPNCGMVSKTVHQYQTRRLRDLDISSREVYLHVRERQFHCKYCNRYFTELLDFADLNKGHTHRQANRIFEFACKLSYAETGAIFNIHAKTIERIVLEKCTKIIDVAAGYKAVRKLGIDELSHRKGKKDFICVITDLDRGIVLDLLPDRKMTTLIAHFQCLGLDFCKQIEYVACIVLFPLSMFISCTSAFSMLAKWYEQPRIIYCHPVACYIQFHKTFVSKRCPYYRIRVFIVLYRIEWPSKCI